jgi:uncharacterized protein (DUF1778 family)
MSHATHSSPKQSRISLEVDDSFHRLLQQAAASQDQTIGQYVLEVIEIRLRRDGDERWAVNKMTNAADSVLAELWDNPNDGEYDRL